MPCFTSGNSVWVSCLYKSKIGARVSFIHCKATVVSGKQWDLNLMSHLTFFSFNHHGRLNQQLLTFLGVHYIRPRLIVHVFNINKPVTLYPHNAICKSKGCCDLYCCYSNYQLIATVKHKEKSVVGTIMASRTGEQVCLPHLLNKLWFEDWILPFSLNGERSINWTHIQSRHQNEQKSRTNHGHFTYFLILLGKDLMCGPAAWCVIL